MELSHQSPWLHSPQVSCKECVAHLSLVFASVVAPDICTCILMLLQAGSAGRLEPRKVCNWSSCLRAGAPLSAKKQVSESPSNSSRQCQLRIGGRSGECSSAAAVICVTF